MKLSVLVENTSLLGFPVEHGLSLHILLNDGTAFLFDVGQSDLFVRNAERMGVALSEVRFAVLSHGHYDHGGGLRVLSELRPALPVYLHRQAFAPHYSLRPDGLSYIGLDRLWQTDKLMNDNWRFCEGETEVCKGVKLFSDVKGAVCCPPGNKLLFADEHGSADLFPDEQNVLISEGNNLVLIAGCAHAGIVNIMHRAEELTGKRLTHVVAGFHLMKMGLSREEEDTFMQRLIDELKQRQCMYYTLHCTGMEAYERLRAELGEQISYLSCGEQIHI